MKRVGIVVIVLAIAASVALGLSRDAADRRSAKAAEFNFRRSSTAVLICKHLTNVDRAATFVTLNGYPSDWVAVDLERLGSEAKALRAVGETDLAAAVDSLQADLGPLGGGAGSRMAWQKGHADVVALSASMCLGPTA